MAGILSLSFLSLFLYEKPAPGGVESPLYWFQTDTLSNKKSIWVDIANPRYDTFINHNKHLNINMHEARYFEGNDTLYLHNTKLEQATMIGAFLPIYTNENRRDFELGVKNIYDLRYNNTSQFEFKSDSINWNSLDSIAYDGGITKVIRTQDFQYVVPEMKILNYTYSRIPTNENNSWKEEKETSILFNFKGYIPEFLIYKKVLSPLELAKVESYFAIKYGLTLDTNYLNSDGDIIWDLAKEGDFNNYVCFIGKDSIGAIFQPTSNATYKILQSDLENPNLAGANDLTANLDRNLTIGFADKTLRNIKDKTFLVWGNDKKDIQFKNKFKDKYGDVKIPERMWLLKNAKGVSEGTLIRIGGDLRRNIEEENVGVLVHIDESLDKQDFIPLINNKNLNPDIVQWERGNNLFKIGKAPRLKFADYYCITPDELDEINDKARKNRSAEIKKDNGVLYKNKDGDLKNRHILGYYYRNVTTRIIQGKWKGKFFKFFHPDYQDCVDKINSLNIGELELFIDGGILPIQIYIDDFLVKEINNRELDNRYIINTQNFASKFKTKAARIAVASIDKQTIIEPYLDSVSVKVKIIDAINQADSLVSINIVNKITPKR